MSEKTTKVVGEISKNSVNLVDRVLISVLVKSEGDGFKETDAGLWTPTEDPKTKAFNFGKIVRLPSLLTEDAYQELLNNLDIGMTVFFQANKSYNFIPHKREDDYKLLMIPLYDIDAFSMMNDSTDA